MDFGSLCNFGCQCGDLEAQSEEDDFCCDDDEADDADYQPVDEEILEYVTAWMRLFVFKPTFSP